jgi:tRNA threonylcarbamoyladenosine biosynthesis protein TsaE
MKTDSNKIEISYISLDEKQFREKATDIAQVWRAQEANNLIVGLEGTLGSGKTTWVRAMLGGLGYQGKVPSPTYTLLEQYQLKDLSVVHLDLYRLPESMDTAEEQSSEFEALGVREWLAKGKTWLLAEWPSRSPQFCARADIWIDFEFIGPYERKLVMSERSKIGQSFLSQLQ